jgi:hypothetical protein
MNLLLGLALHALRRARFAVIAFGGCACVLAACESVNTGSGVSPSSLGVLPKGLVRQAITVCTNCYDYFPVGPFVSFGADNIWITGLSNDPKTGTANNKVPSCAPVIVGVAFPKVNPSYTSFDSIPQNKTCTDTNVGSYTTPNPLPPNNSVGTYLSAVLVNTYAVGFAPSTKSLSCGTTRTGTTCGLIYNPTTGTPVSVVQAPGSCGETYLYGTSDTAIQVGYYTKAPGCAPQAVEEYSPSVNPNQPPYCTTPKPFLNCGPQFGNLYVPSTFGTSPIAYGINTKGDVVGTYATTSGTLSWEYSDLQYSMLPTFGASTTNWQALGINFGNDVVGSYVDTSGTHGFEQTTTPSQAFEIDYEGALSTVVNSINDDQEIVGHYGTSVATISNGFVAFCKQLPSVHCPGSTSDEARGHSRLPSGIGPAARPRR